MHLHSVSLLKNPLNLIMIKEHFYGAKVFSWKHCAIVCPLLLEHMAGFEALASTKKIRKKSAVPRYHYVICIFLRFILIYIYICVWV